MHALLVSALFAAGLAVTPVAAPDAPAITSLLHDFLAGASRNDAAMHERFWADDLIYTGSGGRRIGKADIMKDVRESPPPKPEDPPSIYTAEDIRIQQYGASALLAFRLVATTTYPDSVHVAQYLNSGMFVKRHGAWQAVG